MDYYYSKRHKNIKISQIIEQNLLSLSALLSVYCGLHLFFRTFKMAEWVAVGLWHNHIISTTKTWSVSSKIFAIKSLSLYLLIVFYSNTAILTGQLTKANKNKENGDSISPTKLGGLKKLLQENFKKLDERLQAVENGQRKIIRNF